MTKLGVRNRTVTRTTKVILLLIIGYKVHNLRFLVDLNNVLTFLRRLEPTEFPCKPACNEYLPHLLFFIGRRKKSIIRVRTFDYCHYELCFALSIKHLPNSGSDLGRLPDVIALLFQLGEIFRTISGNVGFIIVIEMCFFDFSKYEGRFHEEAP